MEIKVGLLNTLLKSSNGAIAFLRAHLVALDMLALSKWRREATEACSDFNNVKDDLIKKYGEKGVISPDSPNFVKFMDEYENISEILVSIPLFPFTQEEIINKITENKLEMNDFQFEELETNFWKDCSTQNKEK